MEKIGRLMVEPTLPKQHAAVWNAGLAMGCYTVYYVVVPVLEKRALFRQNGGPRHPSRLLEMDQLR